VTAPLALITNDDGIDSPGLRHLASAAIATGLRVVVAAPLHEASGSSAALTVVQQESRIAMERRALPGLDGVEAYALPAAPAFITLLAHRGAFGEEPSVVLSGINRGANTGSLILHSGTVGAALTAASEGSRGLAVSLCSRAPEHWETAESVAVETIRMLLALPAPVLLSVNVPDVALESLRGLVRAELAEGGAVQTAIAEVGDDFLQLGTVQERSAAAPSSDVALIAEGYATVTPLSPICERRDLALPLPLPLPLPLRAASLPAPASAAAAASRVPAPPRDAPPAR
jgi:5'/3'-nucleotidase